MAAQSARSRWSYGKIVDCEQSKSTAAKSSIYRSLLFNRPYLRCPPSLHALKDWWDKNNVTWHFRKRVIKLPTRLMSRSSLFILSKQDDDFWSCKSKVSISLTSLLRVVRMSTVVSASIKVAMITSNQNFSLSSSLGENFFIFFCLE